MGRTIINDGRIKFLLEQGKSIYEIAEDQGMTIVTAQKHIDKILAEEVRRPGLMRFLEKLRAEGYEASWKADMFDRSETRIELAKEGKRLCVSAKITTEEQLIEQIEKTKDMMEMLEKEEADEI